ncbi:MAG: sodium:proton antiporter [Gammaproteobacteria bacterium]|nr:MAG: sodium:proton antiporter [Gammaproteobacteria bacterium]
MNSRNNLCPWLAATLLVLPGLAAAHTGNTGNGWLSAALHPLTGADHLLALLAVGLVASRQPPAMQLKLAGVVVTGLLAGLFVTTLTLALPWMELAIAGSVVLAGVLLATRPQRLNGLILALIGAFFSLHGLAHATELAGLNAVGLATGLVSGSLLVLVGAQLAGEYLNPGLLRWTGMATALSGLLMMSA